MNAHLAPSEHSTWTSLLLLLIVPSQKEYCMSLLLFLYCPLNLTVDCLCIILCVNVETAGPDLSYLSVNVQNWGILKCYKAFVVMYWLRLSLCLVHNLFVACRNHRMCNHRARDPCNSLLNICIGECVHRKLKLCLAVLMLIAAVLHWYTV